MLRSLEQPFVTHVNKITAEFYNGTIVDDFDYFSRLLGINDDDRKNRKVKSFLQKSLDRQVAFIEYCATCKLHESDTRENLAATKKWVSMQIIGCLSRKTIRPSYLLFFYLTNGSKVFTFVNNLAEIDFADIYSATFFEAIAVANHTWPYLTKTNLNRTLKTISEDMAFDGYEIEYVIPEEYAPSRKNAIIYAQCQIEGMPSIDKIVKIRKTNELFRTDVLKLFKP